MYFGGDYNPEQWPASVWASDFSLMREASVNLVTVGVFSWSRLQPTPDTFDFGWLDEVLDGLHEAGIGVCLATPTASPPPWFTRRYPDSMPVTREGVRLTHGSRDTYCVNAPAYRAASVRIASELAARYGTHPALRLWHVHNEYGTWCFCSHCALEFRAWLRTRYSTVDVLNDAWSTDFWSQRYAEWDEIVPPRATQYLRNPAQELDYRRFMSDSFLRHFLEQKAVLAGAPVTTNFVLGDWVPVDHARWSSFVDLVAIDDYPPDLAGRAFSADKARGWALAAGHPAGRWLLMEHAPGYSHTSSGLRRSTESLSSVASVYLDRGAVGIMYFQWRASRGGAEQWHPALVGFSSPVFAEACSLGASLASRSPADVSADVAVVYDEESMWAWQSPHLPTRVDYTSLVQSWHASLAARGPVDVIPVGAPLGGYRLLVVPALYLMSASAHEWLRSYSGQLVITAGTGLVDEHLRMTPDSLADLIGASVVERDFSPWLDTLAPLAAGAREGVTYLPTLDVVDLEQLTLNS
ncbi:beta-galactosidase [Hamadaea sp.]|uniref:beta-galactosidase n=1 Tax=Hamadaea sp. TaxID=2024425 RepID=UPI0025C62D4B|nr:beta-galactosidase [Hamadaea sp.]